MEWLARRTKEQIGRAGCAGMWGLGCSGVLSVLCARHGGAKAIHRVLRAKIVLMWSSSDSARDPVRSVLETRGESCLPAALFCIQVTPRARVWTENATKACAAPRSTPSAAQVRSPVVDRRLRGVGAPEHAHE